MPPHPARPFGIDGYYDNQRTRQDALLQHVGPALKAFCDATKALGVASQVTAFTRSDFGRTLKTNASGGTDHGWGNHHFVIGGAVNGTVTYGTVFPNFGNFATTDLGFMKPG